MKFLYLSAFILSAFFVLPASAQLSSSGTPTGETLSFGAEGGFGFYSKAYTPYDYEIQVLSKFEYPIVDDSFNLTASLGYAKFLTDQTVRYIFGRPDSYSQPAYNYVTAKVGGKLYVNDFLYGELEAGASVSLTNTYETELIYSPGVGVSFPIFDTKAIDFGVRYEGWNQKDNYGDVIIKQFMSFRLLYKFGIGQHNN